MLTAWYQNAFLRMTVLLGGLLLVLSGCHYHHLGGHSYRGGGHYSGGYDRGGHRDYGYDRRGHRGRHGGGHRRGGWRGRH